MHLRFFLRTHALATSILLALLALLNAADALHAQRYPFFNIGIEEGLVQSQVQALAQDHAGHLWAGTLGGLASYDGHRFRSFTMRDGLPSNIITALHTDVDGTLWVGTSRGLCAYDGFGFKKYPLPDNTVLPKGAVNQIVQLRDGSVWFVVARQLFHISNGKVVAASIPQGCDGINALLARADGSLAIVGRAATAIYQKTGSGWDSLALPKKKRPVPVYKLYEDAQNRLVILTIYGVYAQNAADWRLIVPHEKASDPLMYSFSTADDGSYWFGSARGAIHITGDSLQHFAKSEGLSDVMISDLLRDREGNIWLASNGEGLYRFSGATFTAVDERMGLNGPQVSSIAQDAKGIIYFGSYDGGLYRYDGRIVKRIPFPVGPVQQPVAALLMRENTLWIGGQENKLWKYNTATGEMRAAGEVQRGAAFIALLQDEQGLLAATTKNIYRIVGDSMKALSLPTLTIDAVVSLGRDSLLIATPDGLLLYHQQHALPFKTGSAADSGQIVCLDFRNGTLWMGTSDNGVLSYELATGKRKHITTRDGLRSPFIYNIYVTPGGDVWVGTGYGICRIRPDGERPQVSFYGRSAGIVGMESNRNAIFPMPDGNIWFGTIGGAVLYHAGAAEAKTEPVSLQVQSIRLFGDNIRDTAWYHGLSPFYGVPQALRLPWRQNNLSFSFAAISLSGAEDLRYRYRLEGSQTPWSKWSNENAVTFSALPPGSYTLLVQCSTNGVHPLSAQLSYPFEIITPFQKTALFRLLVIGGCIALGVGIQYILARKKRRRAALIEALRREEQAKVRQRTAEDFHDEVGNKITRINVLTNVLRSKVGTPAPADVGRLIDSIQDNASQLYSGTRDILWSLQPANDTLYQVLHRIRDFGLDLFGDTEIGFSMEGIREEWKGLRLPIDVSRNLIMIFKEALNNALKYAMADKVSLRVDGTPDRLHFTLTDDGKGFDVEKIKRGQGMGNMQIRAKRLSATFHLDSMPGKGTTLKLTIPLKRNSL